MPLDYATCCKWVGYVPGYFSAPLKSMASNVGGLALRGRGQAPFKDARGASVCSRGGEGDKLHSLMLSKCGTLRFICVDEVEATGAGTAGKLEGNARKRISNDSPYRRTCEGEPRMFGRVNVVFFGD